MKTPSKVGRTFCRHGPVGKARAAVAAQGRSGLRTLDDEARVGIRASLGEDRVEQNADELLLKIAYQPELIELRDAAVALAAVDIRALDKLLGQNRAEVVLVSRGSRGIPIGAA